MTLETHTTFATANEDSWVPSGSALTSGTATDATAPQSPSSVGQILYPDGFAGGDTPGQFERALSSSHRRLYIGFWLKLSSNWQAQPDGINKILHGWTGGTNKLVVMFTSTSAGAGAPLVSLCGYQGAVSGSNNFQGSIAIPRGTWQLWEVLAELNAAGQTNGRLRVWLDGALDIDQQNIQWNTGGGGAWDVLQWSPTWGGLSGTVSGAMSMWIDDLYVSGSN